MPYGTGAIMFNAYHDNDLSLQQMARVLSFMVGMTYTKIPDLCNRGSCSGTLYINGGKGQYVDLPGKELNSYDFELDDPEEKATCYACGDVIDVDDAPSFNGCYYCQDCFDERFAVCGHCGEAHRSQHMNEVRGSYYCNDCYSEIFITCSECNDEIHKDSDDCYYVDDDALCAYCYDHKCARCEDCGEDHLTENMTETEDGGAWYCDDCVDDHTCADCGKVYSDCTESPHDDKLRCDECNEKHEEDIETNPLEPAHDERLAPTPLDSELYAQLVACPMQRDGVCACERAIEKLNPLTNHQLSAAQAGELITY